MWVNKAEYLKLREENASYKKWVELLESANASMKLRIAEQIDWMKAEKARAEAAIDEMVKIATVFQAQPIAQEARERLDPGQFDNIFEEEDPSAVARDQAILSDAGVGALFEEYSG